MLQALVTMAATEGGESSHGVFYALGGLLAALAVVVSAIGISRRETFPPTPGAARAVMGLAVVMVVVVCASAVITA